MAVMCYSAGVLLLTLSVFVKESSSAGGWNYEEASGHGPSDWGKSFPACDGLSQSPINVEGDIPVDQKLQYFDFSEYNQEVKGQLSNAGGHTLKFTLSNEVPVYVRGGSLPGDYRLAQIHFHWGGHMLSGSEHTFGPFEYHYPLEMHLVHVKDNPIENDPEALAVIGVFFLPLPFANNGPLNQLLAYVGDVKTPEAWVDLQPINLLRLTQMENSVFDMDYIRYSGSLTTPPCSETVIWSLSRNTNFIAPSQLAEFRKLLDLEGHPMENNFRPTQPLNGRKLTKTG